MKIAFLIDSEPTQEQLQAYKWVRARTGCAFPVEIEKIFETNLDDFNIIWWHYDKNLALPEIADGERFKSIIFNFFKRGGNLLLTLSAVKLLNKIQIEPVEPDFENFEVDFTSIAPRGFVSFLGHPVFRKLQNGVNTYLQRQGDRLLTIAYVKRTPGKLRVVGVEKLGGEINPEKKILFEFEDNGRVIAIGGNVYFSAVENPFFYNLDRLVLNSLLYLNNPRKFPEPKTYWCFYDGVKQVKLSIEDKALRTAQKKIGEKDTGLYVGGYDYFLVQGRGIFAKVSKSGMEQVSIFPFQFVEYLKIFLKSDTKLHPAQDVKVIFKPEAVVREFEIESIKFREKIFSHPKKSVMVLNLLTTSKDDFEICFDVRISPKILNLSVVKFRNFYFSYEEKLKAVYVFNNALFSLFVGSSRKPEAVEFESDGDGLNVKVFYKISAGIDKAFNFCVAGRVKHPQSDENVIVRSKEIYKFALRFPHKVFKENFKVVKDTFRKRLIIFTPDEELNKSFKLAISIIPKFAKSVKTLGNFWMDGFNGCSVNLKKVFSALPVLLKIGEYEIVRDTLEFVGRYMDIRGEIPSKFSFSGVFEYEDEELKWNYVKICADYLRYSKDKLFAKFTWGRLKKMVKRDKEIRIKKDIVDSLLLFAKVVKDEEWVNMLGELKVEESNEKNLQGDDSVKDAFNVNSGLSISKFIDVVLSRYCIFDVNSFDKKVYISPLIEDGWGFFEIRNLRVQNMRINVFMKREDNYVVFSFEKGDIPEIKIVFEPRFWRKITVAQVLVDNKQVQDFEFDGEKVKLEFPFRFKKEIKIFFD